LRQEDTGTRYVQAAIRTMVDPNDDDDVAEVHRLQDAITVDQADPGRFEVPDRDERSQTAIRNHLKGLLPYASRAPMFGDAHEVDPISHLIGTAVGWGGLPRHAVVYRSVHPAINDGRQAYEITVGDVPCDAFWSVTVYNADGYVDANDAGVYSCNSVTATRNEDGTCTIRLGDDPAMPNRLPIMPGWSYTVRT
jgi:Uncharacterized conserved protein